MSKGIFFLNYLLLQQVQLLNNFVIFQSTSRTARTKYHLPKTIFSTNSSGLHCNSNCEYTFYHNHLYKATYKRTIMIQFANSEK